jgi:hypothetical protein
VANRVIGRSGDRVSKEQTQEWFLFTRPSDHRITRYLRGRPSCVKKLP